MSHINKVSKKGSHFRDNLRCLAKQFGGSEKEGELPEID